MSPAPARGRFAVAVTCIDGRIQESVRDRLLHDLWVDHVDVVTVPGVDGRLLVPGPDRDHVRICVEVSVEAHGSRVAVVAGHTDCAGHPVTDEQHARDVRAATEWLCSEFPELDVSGLLVETSTGTVRVVAAHRSCARQDGA